MHEDSAEKGQELSSLYGSDGECTLDVTTVTQSNELIRASQKMSLRAKRVMLIMLARMNPLAVDQVLETQVSADDYAKLTGTSSNSSIDDVKKGARELIGIVIAVQNHETGEITESGLVDKIRYMPDGKFVDIIVRDEYRSHFYDLKQRGFTSLQLNDAIGFKRFYTTRLFEQFCSWRKTSGLYRVTLSALKMILGVKEKSYPRFVDFKNRVLKPAITEINEAGSMSVEFKTHRVNKVVRSVEFIITNVSERSMLDQINNNNPYHLPANLSKEEKKEKLIKAMSESDVRAELERNGQQRID